MEKNCDAKVLLGNNIRTLRKQKKLSQEQLSELLNITPKHLGTIENGNAFVSSEVLEKIANVLEVPIYVLFYSADSEADMEADTKVQETRFKELDLAIDEVMLKAGAEIKIRLRTGRK